MCGLNGIISISAKSAAWPAKDLQLTLRAMNESIRHRGPDAEGVFIRPPIAFGFRRLSIIDLDSTANQPMLSSDGSLVLIFNGEIYNYLEIRDTLIAKGYQFKTKSDTEVILSSYQEYGESCVQYFNGMWAFALYDFNENKLFCSRDRLGVKPFYYTQTEDKIYFSSELKALHKILTLNEANLAKVYEYLAYGYRVNDGDTFLEGVKELLPGTNLTIKNGKMIFSKYWNLSENLYQLKKGISYHDEYMSLFSDAVKIRYRSDVPVALLLSGGLDSSAIGKVTDNLIEEGNLNQNEIHAYIASFPGFEQDETAIARKFIKTCRNIKLHELQIDTKRIVNSLEDSIHGFDHPVFSFNCIVHNNIMRECKRQQIKVVLNGQGSDEAFAGYDRYNAGVFLMNQLLGQNGKFLREFGYLHQKNKWPTVHLLGQMLKSILNQNYTAFLRAKYKEKTIHCLSNDFVNDHYRHYQPQFKFRINQDNFTNYLLYTIKQQGLNQILHYEDVSSMNQSIEIRSPFLDYRIMEFAFSIPAELKLKNGITKKIQRETVGKMLPSIITNNRHKIGFKTPFIDYLEGDKNFYDQTNDLLSSRNFNSRIIWDPDKIRKVFNNKTKYPEFPYWRILNLEIWANAYNISNI